MKKILALLLSAVICLSAMIPIFGIFASGENADVTPVFDSFGTETALSGSWSSETAENVGTAFRLTAASVAELNSGIQDFMLDFKVNIPVNSVSPISVLMRGAGESAYELTVNKNAGAGIYFGGKSETAFADSSLNIADEKWHSVSIRMLDGRAVLLLDGVKILDRTLADTAISGALTLKVNTIDVLVSGITLSDVTEEDMDTVADYDFSADTYPNAMPGWKTAFDTADDVNGLKTTTSWATAHMKSASTDETVQALGLVTDFALTFNAKWEMGSNSYQRGVQIKLPNGSILLIGGQQCRYDNAQIAEHSALGTDWHRFDVVSSGTSLKVFIDRKEVYNITVTAATTPAYVGIHTFCGNSGDPYKFKDIELKVGTGVHDPEPAPELEQTETLYTKLNNNGWVRDNMSVYSSNSTVEKPYDGWGCALTAAQNFIVNFNLTVGAEQAGYVELRLRHYYDSLGNYGYQLRFAADKLTVAKYNDGTNNITVLETLSADFSGGTDVRIAANEEMLWIALDGIRVFSIDNAFNESGKIQLSHTTDLSEKGAVITDLSILRYKEATANDGISDPEKTDVIMSGDDIAAGMKGQGWTTVEGGTAATPNSAWNKEYDGWGYKIAKVQNFIFDFTLKFAADEDGAVELRLRHDTTSVCNLGYRLYFTQDTLTVGKYNTENFQNTQIGKVINDFTAGSKVRIAANGGTLWIAVDGVRVFSITDAYNENGYIQISHTAGVPEGNITLTDMLLREYSDEAANDGVSDKTTGDSDILMTGNEIITSMCTSASFTKQDAQTAVNAKATGAGVVIAQANDFILDFTLRIAPSDTGYLQVRIRHSYNSVCNLGYVMQFSANGVSLNRYNSNNFQSTAVDSRRHDFSSSTRVRIAANGGTVWVSLNGEKVFTLTDAYNESNKILIQNSFSGAETAYFSEPCLYKYTDAIANQVISAPAADTTEFPVAEMVALDKILELFKKVGHDITETSVINNTAGSSKGVNLCGTKDFILNFKVKIKENSSGAVTVKFRHYYQDANYGYLLNIDRKSAAFTRYLEKKDGSATTYGTEKIDFTKGVDVRIVAKDGLVWIAFDGVKKFELTDAALYSGQIQFLVSGENADVELSKFKLTSYGEPESYEGMASRELQLTVPKILRDYEVANQADVTKIFYGKMDYENLDGVNTFKFSSTGQSSETSMYGQKVTDFVFSFNVNMDSCSAAHYLQMNFRKRYDSVCNYGFVITLTQSELRIANYSSSGYSVGKTVAKTSVKLSGWVPVKVVAQGDTVAVFLNGEAVLKCTVNELEAGTITFQNNVSGANNIYFSDMLLTECYDGAMPEGEVEVVSSPTNIAKKTYKDAVKIVLPHGSDVSAVSGSFPVAAVVIAGAAVLVAGVGAVVIILILKKRKKKA